jgi:hypothetical protein
MKQESGYMTRECVVCGLGRLELQQHPGRAGYYAQCTCCGSFLISHGTLRHLPIWIRERGSRRDLLRYWISLRHRAGEERPVVDGPLLKELESGYTSRLRPSKSTVFLAGFASTHWARRYALTSRRTDRSLERRMARLFAWPSVTSRLAG